MRLRGNRYVGCLGDVTLSGTSGRVTSLELTHSRSVVQDGCPDQCHVTSRCDDVTGPRRCVNNYVTGSCDCSLSSQDDACQQRGRYTTRQYCKNHIVTKKVLVILNSCFNTAFYVVSLWKINATD